MKGISAVLAVVLIVVITVAIIGLAYGWATGLFGITTAASEEQVGGVTGALQKSVQIVAASCTNEYGGEVYSDTAFLYFTVKNTGTLAIDGSELNFFIDESPIENKWGPVKTSKIDPIEPSETRQFVYGTTEREFSGAAVTLKVDAPAGAVEKDVEACPLLMIGALICDNDGICERENGENEITCPSDCPPSTNGGSPLK